LGHDRGGPAGTDHFVAIVSENPRDFSAAGLRKVDPFGEFPPDVGASSRRRREARRSSRATPSAQEPVLARYGAAIFSIEEID
jgi:hypothetical protein